MADVALGVTTPILPYSGVGVKVRGVEGDSAVVGGVAVMAPSPTLPRAAATGEGAASFPPCAAGGGLRGGSLQLTIIR
ncbi:MAG: hypothetical protein GTN71_05325 [Anaerolineae bacterium]|nr:hypothetical protein [Anaerolineae bacterium]